LLSSNLRKGPNRPGMPLLKLQGVCAFQYIV
jgi:hypothetical protein